MYTRSIRFPSIRSNIKEVESFLLKICEEKFIGQEEVDRIMIAVTEAVNNAMIHGNGLNPSKSVELLCECNNEQMEFVVRDEGDGFEPDTVPDPRMDSNLLKEGGRGVLIIRCMMDAVEFRRHKMGMELRLTINIHQPQIQ